MRVAGNYLNGFGEAGLESGANETPAVVSDTILPAANLHVYWLAPRPCITRAARSIGKLPIGCGTLRGNARGCAAS